MSVMIEWGFDRQYRTEMSLEITGWVKTGACDKVLANEEEGLDRKEVEARITL